MRKSWLEKLEGAKPPHFKELAKPFAGFPAGARMLISSPPAVKAYMDTIPPGETRSVPDMRRDLAARDGAELTCPVSTGIFVRIAAEAALEDLNSGAAPQDVTPFWRVVDPESPTARKLSCGPAFVRELRDREASR